METRHGTDPATCCDAPLLKNTKTITIAFLLRALLSRKKIAVTEDNECCTTICIGKEEKCYCRGCYVK